jgi:hypothetical protein
MITKRAAISISEETLIQVEEIARELGKQRSQLISTGLAEFVARCRSGGGRRPGFVCLCPGESGCLPTAPTPS